MTEYVWTNEHVQKITSENQSLRVEMGIMRKNLEMEKDSRDMVMAEVERLRTELDDSRRRFNTALERAKGDINHYRTKLEISNNSIERLKTDLAGTKQLLQKGVKLMDKLQIDNQRMETALSLVCHSADIAVEEANQLEATLKKRDEAIQAAIDALGDYYNTFFSRIKLAVEILRKAVE